MKIEAHLGPGSTLNLAWSEKSKVCNSNISIEISVN